MKVFRKFRRLVTNVWSLESIFYFASTFSFKGLNYRARVTILFIVIKVVINLIETRIMKQLKTT